MKNILIIGSSKLDDNQMIFLANWASAQYGYFYKFVKIAYKDGEYSYPEQYDTAIICYDSRYALAQDSADYAAHVADVEAQKVADQKACYKQPLDGRWQSTARKEKSRIKGNFKPLKMAENLTCSTEHIYVFDTGSNMDVISISVFTDTTKSHLAHEAYDDSEHYTVFEKDIARAVGSEIELAKALIEFKKTLLNRELSYEDFEEDFLEDIKICPECGRPTVFKPNSKDWVTRFEDNLYYYEGYDNEYFYEDRNRKVQALQEPELTFCSNCGAELYID